MRMASLHAKESILNWPTYAPEATGSAIQTLAHELGLAVLELGLAILDTLDNAPLVSVGSL